jgi:hypothetical protein
MGPILMRFCLAVLFALGACANSLPDTDKTISSAAQNAPFPALIPIEGLLTSAQDGSRIEAATADLQARAARLRLKAAALRGRTIIDGQDRLRRLNLR